MGGIYYFYCISADYRIKEDQSVLHHITVQVVYWIDVFTRRCTEAIGKETQQDVTLNLGFVIIWLPGFLFPPPSHALRPG